MSHAKFLDKVYDARGGQETRTLYDAWSGSYDEEVSEAGYVTPQRCAEALRGVMTAADAPVLDFGCGTGLSGKALSRAGFTTIDGLDISEEMLRHARDTGIYRKLTRLDPDTPPKIKRGAYNAIAAIGVIGAGAAPATVVDDLMHSLKRGGFLVMSVNDHTLRDHVCNARINEWVDCGAARLLVCEDGPHLPGRDLNAYVYVFERM